MKNKGYVYQNRITAVDAKRGVLEFYTQNYPRFSRETWANRIQSGQIFRNREAVNINDLLQPGDILEYRRPSWEEPEVPTKFGILFEDAHLLIVNKPAGLPVLPGDVYLENTLLTLVRKRISPKLSPIHRLDRSTSGAVVFAKTVASRRHLSEAIQKGEILKTYLAVATGNAMPNSFTVSAPIGTLPHPISGMVAAVTADGRPSETRIRVVRRYEGQSLLMTFLKTGRPHQIRIHLAEAGFPLVGEQFYGSGGRPRPGAVQPGKGKFLLHAWRLRLSHPITGQRLRVTAPLPVSWSGGWE
ncbi:MAG: RNA pseudouridine synthase [Acidobacteria bacterium]|nr:MAG: RNA pseudouridine synthase [Acidobacteriota bacterium]